MLNKTALTFTKYLKKKQNKKRKIMKIFMFCWSTKSVYNISCSHYYQSSVIITNNFK